MVFSALGSIGHRCDLGGDPSLLFHPWDCGYFFKARFQQKQARNSKPLEISQTKRGLFNFQYLRLRRKLPYFRDALKSNDNGRSASQSIFVEAPPTHHHPTHKDSDSHFFSSNALITETRMLTFPKKRLNYWSKKQ